MNSNYSIEVLGLGFFLLSAIGWHNNKWSASLGLLFALFLLGSSRILPEEIYQNLQTAGNGVNSDSSDTAYSRANRPLKENVENTWFFLTNFSHLIFTGMCIFSAVHHFDEKRIKAVFLSFCLGVIVFNLKAFIVLLVGATDPYLTILYIVLAAPITYYPIKHLATQESINRKHLTLP